MSSNSFNPRAHTGRDLCRPTRRGTDEAVPDTHAPLLISLMTAWRFIINMACYDFKKLL
jgi:hypothetical protein